MAAHPDPEPDPAALLRAVQRWGRHSLSYSILQPGMQYFGSDSRGWIGFRRRLGQAIVLGDPVCPPEERAALLQDFVRRYPLCMFMQCGAATVEVLRPLGFRATPVGVENDIDTQHFSLEGKPKRDLRHYRNKAVEGGVTVAEEPDTQELRRELRPISDSWLPMKSWWQHELEFLARPYVPEPEPGVRIFVGRIDGRAAGFVVLDPMYDHGTPCGYCVTLLRHYPDAPEGTVDYVNLTVIEQFRKEGIPLLSLGVSPFHEMEALAAAHGKGLATAYWAFLCMREYGTPIYHFKGLSFHKSRYRAAEFPVYAALRPPLGLWPLLASARACRMV
ncbi:MAG: DUF2156 domain-containing protein [Candidatus Hydrogenedens sp.]|nr:DUF2156 domain-containing protein [Candidatus Hydrogenedens sp.]